MSTVKLFYKDAFRKEFSSVVQSCEEMDKGYEVVLAETCFYPEGGGQGADTGVLQTADGEKIRVTDVHEHGEEIAHTCDRPVAVGETVTGIIDWEKRFDHMQQHSGEHIVSGMLCSTYNCDNVGFHMGVDSVVIDYNADISWDGVMEIEKRANEYIWEGHDFVEMWPDAEELKALNYRSKKALEGAVRITSFPGADMCACCGTHVKNSSQVGLVKFISSQKFKDGVRLELLCGKRAFDYLSANCDENRSIAEDMSTRYDRTFSTYLKLKNELQNVKARMNGMEKEYFEMFSEKFKEMENVLCVLDDMEGDSLRGFAQSVSGKISGCVAVFAGNDAEGGNYKYVIMNPGKDITELVKAVNIGLNGRGGGRDGFAQGSVKCEKNQIMQLDRFKNFSI